VKGRCVKATAKNHANKRCKRPVAIKVSYTLTGPASVRFVVSAHGSITLTGKTGNNTFIFNGKIGGHTLGPGTYRLTATLTGGSSRTVTFRIVR
jgi:hypothetical protein